MIHVYVNTFNTFSSQVFYVFQHVRVVILLGFPQPQQQTSIFIDGAPSLSLRYPYLLRFPQHGSLTTPSVDLQKSHPSFPSLMTIASLDFTQSLDNFLWQYRPLIGAYFPSILMLQISSSSSLNWESSVITSQISSSNSAKSMN